MKLPNIIEDFGLAVKHHLTNLKQYYIARRECKKIARELMKFCKRNEDSFNFTHDYKVCTSYVWYTGPFRIVLDRYKLFKILSLHDADGRIMQYDLHSGLFRFIPCAIYMRGDFTVDDMIPWTLTRDPLKIPDRDYGGHY